MTAKLAFFPQTAKYSFLNYCTFLIFYGKIAQYSKLIRTFAGNWTYIYIIRYNNINHYEKVNDHNCSVVLLHNDHDG